MPKKTIHESKIWISTKDEFPPTYSCVILYHIKIGATLGFRFLYLERWKEMSREHEDRFKKMCKNEYAWDYMWPVIPPKGSKHGWTPVSSFASDEEVSHWMPMYIPPEEK